MCWSVARWATEGLFLPSEKSHSFVRPGRYCDAPAGRIAAGAKPKSARPQVWRVGILVGLPEILDAHDTYPVRA